ncbi:MAG: hypothetical protein PHW82_14550 [Bacteroidales bacterium]|nr:hypothetical protein [Bacteroidales bacterium]
MKNIGTSGIIKIMQKYHVKVITLAVLLQLIAYFFIGLKSFIFITPIIIFASLWLFAKVWINRLVKDSDKKINYITIVSSVFIIICVLELLLRLLGIVAVYSEKRSYYYRSMYDDKFADFFVTGRNKPIQLYSGSEYSYSRTPNNEGYSDKNWKIAKPDSCFRIIAIGDSFTEGDGADQDSTWIKFFERKINKSNFDYFNAGLCGSDPVFGYYNLEHKLIKYKPDLVILCINPSDIDDIIIRGGFERFQNNEIVFRKGPWWEFIYASCHVSRVFYNHFYNWRLLPKYEEVIENKKSLEIIQNCLLKFKHFSANNNCQFICVYHPFQYEVSKYKNSFENTMSFCEENSIVYVDLYEYYQNRKIETNINQYYWEKDGHHKSKGYELMADGIYEGLKQNQLMP